MTDTKMHAENMGMQPPSCTAMEEKNSNEYVYITEKAPRLAGFFLKCFCWLLEMSLLHPIILFYLKKVNNVTKIFMNTQYSEEPMYKPQYFDEIEEEKFVQVLETKFSAPECVAAAVECLPPYLSNTLTYCGKEDQIDVRKFQYATIRDYADAYTSGRVTPTEVAKRFLTSIEDSRKMSRGLNLFISLDFHDVISQAAAATERYRQGKPLSVLDGVLVAVKDEIDCLPYPTTGGSTWLGKARQVTKDAAVVKRLRECGAVMVGKTNMHELGVGTTGINPHYGATRNPHDMTRVSGGSSGGSATVVAAGLCPVALGVDGGGSVRMPASLSGVVGLKPTFGRIAKSGLLPLNWTIGMVGTLTGTVEDAYIVYAAVQGHLPSDKLVSIPPPATLPLLNDVQMEPNIMAKLIEEIKLAKFSKWYNDSDDSVWRVCDSALRLIQDTYGCKVVDASIPDLDKMRLAHYITMGGELTASLGVEYENLGRKTTGGDVRSTISIFQGFSNREFVTAQRLRSRCMQHHMEVFKEADFIVTPTTACTAPPIRDDAEQYGELDYQHGGRSTI